LIDLCSYRMATLLSRDTLPSALVTLDRSECPALWLITQLTSTFKNCQLTTPRARRKFSRLSSTPTNTTKFSLLRQKLRNKPSSTQISILMIIKMHPS
jgi:hypothetical protein